MADSQRLAGVASVTIDGKAFSIAGEGTYTLSGASREPLVGQDGYHGYSERPQPGKIMWSGRDSSQVSIDALNNSSNVTVVLSLANGKTIIGRNMTRMGEPISVKTEDATFEVDFVGPDVTEA